MKFSPSFSITDIIKYLLKLGANITEKQVEVLKWRLSKEGQLCYNQEEINEFYKALEKGNTEILDISLFEKQQKINSLLEEIEDEEELN